MLAVSGFLRPWLRVAATAEVPVARGGISPVTTESAKRVAGVTIVVEDPELGAEAAHDPAAGRIGQVLAGAGDIGRPGMEDEDGLALHLDEVAHRLEGGGVLQGIAVAVVEDDEVDALQGGRSDVGLGVAAVEAEAVFLRQAQHMGLGMRLDVAAGSPVIEQHALDLGLGGRVLGGVEGAYRGRGRGIGAVLGVEAPGRRNEDKQKTGWKASGDWRPWENSFVD